MAVQTKTVLKTYFETGDKPTQSEFADLIDSFEDTSNKSTSVVTDSGSNTKFPSVKSVFDWATGRFQDAIGFTPENVANKSTSVVTDSGSNTKFPSVKSVFDWATGRFQAILTEVDFGSFVVSLSSKSIPIDADCFVVIDSADSNKSKKTTFQNVKNQISSFFGFKDVHYSDSSVTGTTSQTIVESVLIPAGTVTVGKTIFWFPRFRKTGSAGQVTLKGYLNTSVAIGGSNFYSPAIFSSGTLRATANKFGIVKSATITEFHGNLAEDMTTISGTNSVVSYNIDWTVDQYIVVTIQLTSSSDIGTYSGHLLEIK